MIWSCLELFDREKATHLTHEIRCELTPLVCQDLSGNSYSREDVYKCLCDSGCFYTWKWYSLRVLCGVVNHCDNESVSLVCLGEDRTDYVNRYSLEWDFNKGYLAERNATDSSLLDSPLANITGATKTHYV